jgi:HPt (histidine-containing phosphotransfer) domain-containing protein
MELEEICEALGLEKEEFVEFARLFLDVAFKDLASMEDALAKGDMRSLAEGAHSIKGAASTLDMEEIFILARSLELKAKRGGDEGIYEELQALREELIRLQNAIGEDDCGKRLRSELPKRELSGEKRDEKRSCRGQ